jgi:hypothetical protein
MRHMHSAYKHCRWTWIAMLLSAAWVGPGCASGPETDTPPPAPAPELPPKSAKTDYWFAKPGVATVSAGDYDRLWEACGAAARDRFFVLDRTNYREGVLTTQPLVSRQFFELWRSDALTFDDTMQSSLQAIRRTIHFSIEKTDSGYTATPKVVVERYANVGRRLTSPLEFQQAFNYRSISGSAERDAGVVIANQYWYAIGRDPTLEAALADSVRSRVQTH